MSVTWVRRRKKIDWGSIQNVFKNTLECKHLNSFTEIKQMTCSESHVCTHVPC